MFGMFKYVRNMPVPIFMERFGLSSNTSKSRTASWSAQLCAELTVVNRGLRSELFMRNVIYVTSYVIGTDVMSVCDKIGYWVITEYLYIAHRIFNPLTRTACYFHERIQWNKIWNIGTVICYVLWNILRNCFPVVLTTYFFDRLESYYS